MYLADYPSGDLADNAQYWLGETYYVTRDYDNAAVAFRAVGERWPNSRKAPDALLKLGFTQHELKKYAEARATLTQVTKRFPDSEAAKLAAERLKRLPPDAP
jgi:tol-pal system protein YbgF